MKHHEFNTQTKIFRWSRLMTRKYPELALLNPSLSGVPLNKGAAYKAKQAGMVKGYPDMFLPAPKGKYSGLFIELKENKNTATFEQKWWIEQLRNQGYKAEVTKGFDQTINLIEEYLNGKN